MNYIQQAYKGKVELWLYLVGVLLIFCFWQILGVLPFMAALMKKFAADDNLDGLFNLNETTMLTTLESNTTLFFMLLSFAFGLLGLLIVVKKIHKLALVSLTTSRKKIDWKRARFAFVFWGVISSIFVLIDYFLMPESYILNFNLKPFLILVAISIVMIPLQTSFEEYLFRGYLMQGIGVLVKNRWFPLILTSIVFGGMHFWNPEVDKLGPLIMIYYVGTGLFLGIITLMDEGLELALGFHAANNLFTALLVTADWTAFQTHSVLKDISEPKISIDVLLPVLIIYPIILFIFAKKYNWTNWKEKLTGRIEKPVAELNTEEI